MLAWISGNLGTVVVALALLAVVVAAAASLIRGRKQGKTCSCGCGGACGGCASKTSAGGCPACGKGGEKP